jgi:hypothetical protein
MAVGVVALILAVEVLVRGVGVHHWAAPAVVLSARTEAGVMAPIDVAIFRGEKLVELRAEEMISGW